MLVEPVVRAAVPRLAGRHDRAERREIGVGVPVRDQRSHERRRDAEHRDSLRLDEPPDAVGGPVRSALHEDDRRPARHRADHGPRPHDPAHVRREEDAVAGAEIGLVRRLAHDREQEAALDVQRALRLARRARRVREEVRRLALDLDRIERSRPCRRRSRPTRRLVRASSGTSTPARLQTTMCSTVGESTKRLVEHLLHRDELPAPIRGVRREHDLRAGVREARRHGRAGEAGEDRHLDRADVRARVRGDRGLGRHRQEGPDCVALDGRRARGAPRRAVAPRARAPPTSATGALPPRAPRPRPRDPASRAPSGARRPPRRSAARRRTTSSTRSRATRRAPRPTVATSGMPRSSTTARQKRSGSSTETRWSSS